MIIHRAKSNNKNNLSRTVSLAKLKILVTPKEELPSTRHSPRQELESA
jgi:hypothetical protein